MKTTVTQMVRKALWFSVIGAALSTQAAVSPGVLIITEIMQNPSAVSDATGEWFEVYNPGPDAVDMNGWTLKDNDTDSHLVTGSLVVPAGGYAVLGNAAADNGGVSVDYVYSGISLGNSADELVLLDASDVEIDRVEWDNGASFPDPNGKSMTLGDVLADNNDGSNWCEATSTFGDGDFGTPGAANDSCGNTSSAGSEASSSSSPAGSWIINEILADPDATLGDANGDGSVDTSQDEFVEIVNATGSAADIGGWTLSDGVSVRHTFAASTVVPDGGSVIVFGGGTPTGDFHGSLVFTASTGSLGLNNSGDTVTFSDGTSALASVTYGSEGGNNQSLTRDPDLTGDFVIHSAATGSDGTLFSPGTRIDGNSFSGNSSSSSSDASSSSASSTPSLTLIHDIQGSGTASPLTGTDVTIEGIVVGDFQETTELKGFFVQEEDADTDGDPATSEGIFVYAATPVDVGDKVQVSGTVSEYYDLTELGSVSDVTILSSGNTLPTPATLTLPLASADALEAFEGMAVTFTQTLYVTEHYNLARYGQVTLSSTARLEQPTDVAAPGAAANALQAANDLNTILLDDGSNVQNPDPVPFSDNAPNPLSASDTLRGGDTVTNLSGVLYYSYGAYEIVPTALPDFVNANVRPASAPALSGTLKIASFNVLNYFTTIDGGSPVCGPNADQECRGADTASELQRQQDKLVSALTELGADVIGLMELENTDQNAVADLASRLSGYSYIANPDGNGTTLGGDAITVGILYKTATVAPVGISATIADGFGSTDLGTACDANSSDGVYPFDNFNRKPLAQTFEEIKSGAKFTVIVNHLKSKGSLTGYFMDNDQGDGQGNDNCTRTTAAKTLLEWITTDPTGSNDPDFLIMGDLNSYAMEDPIAVFADAGYTNLVNGYSYVFDGQWGSLDHMLANAALAPQVTGGAKWHINADEPRALDYNEEYKSAGQITSFYHADAFRTSDHDPVVIGLDLRSGHRGKNAHPSVLMYLLGN